MQPYDSYKNSTFRVLINQEDQYSIRLVDESLLSGWKETGIKGSIDDCERYVNKSTLKRIKKGIENSKKENPNLKPFFNFLITLYVIFINKLFLFFVGGKNRPIFIDTKKNYPELLELDKNYQVIREELEKILAQRLNIPKYHEVDPTQTFISRNDNADKQWRIFHLICYGENPTTNRMQCPKTSTLLDKIPYVQEAFFSILEPGKSIPAHSGPFLGVVRYHLTLTTPKENPPKIRVHDCYYTWKEGESIMFDDTWNHEVNNNSDDIRVVLFLDVKRKLPFLLDSLNQFFLNLLGKQYGKIVRENLNWNR